MCCRPDAGAHWVHTRWAEARCRGCGERAVEPVLTGGPHIAPQPKTSGLLPRGKVRPPSHRSPGSVAAQRVDGSVDACGEAVAVGLRAADECRALEEEQ